MLRALFYDNYISLIMLVLFSSASLLPVAKKGWQKERKTLACVNAFPQGDTRAHIHRRANATTTWAASLYFTEILKQEY